ncbi:MAG: TetR/AcrR family transcriptional regulator [Acidimicrobiaceae bacterium]|nr:TetR/AcrR family transcriptional regulator [Acidimicrobiaceae bacterium]
MKVERSAAETKAHLIRVMADMLREIDVADVRVNDLSKRAEVSVPTIYYHFRSLDDLIILAIGQLLERFIQLFDPAIIKMTEAIDLDRFEMFREGLEEYVTFSWSRELNDEVHRVAPQIMVYRRLRPELLDMRRLQSTFLEQISSVLHEAIEKGWIAPDTMVNTFVIHHLSTVFAQALFYHPSFGALSGVQWREGVGHLMLTTATDSLESLPVQ